MPSSRVARTSAASDDGRMFTWPLVNLMVANAALRLCNYMHTVLVPLYVLAEGESATIAGLTTALFMGTAVLFRPLGGRWVDGRGRFPVMMIGAVLFSGAAAAFTADLSIALFLAARAVQGAGFSLNGTASMTLATDLIPARRMTEGLGYLGLEAVIAQVAGPPLALAVLATAGFNAAFMTAFAISVITVLARLPLRRTIAHRSQDRRRARAVAGRPRLPWWQHLIDRDAATPAAIMFLINAGTVCINVFATAYLAAMSVSRASAFFIAGGIAVGAARLVVGRLDRRFGTGKTTGVAMGLLVIALLCVAARPEVVGAAVAGVLFGAGLGTVQPGLSALAVTTARAERRGMANSTVFLAMDLGNTIGAIGFGLLASQLGLGPVFVASAGVIAMTLGLFALLRCTGRLREPDSPPPRVTDNDAADAPCPTTP